jgi:hypothetical protein
MAGFGAQAAAVTFFPVDSDYFPDHKLPSFPQSLFHPLSARIDITE